MKRLLLLSFVALCLSFNSGENKTIILAQFERLQGEWEGYMEYTDYTDDKTKMRMPAKCITSFDGSKWIYDVQYDDGSGEFAGGGGDCSINDDGSQLNYNGIKWNVTDVISKGDSCMIRMETRGKDNRKKAALRQTIEATSDSFMIVEMVKYENSEIYFVRNKHFFRKKKI